MVELAKKSKSKKAPMWRRLFLYMSALVGIVLIILFSGLFLLGNFSTAKQNAETALSFQLNAYERQISKYYEDLTRMGTALSDGLVTKTEAFLAQEGIAFEEINDNEERIASLQKAVFDKLETELLKTHCSGAFLLFDATTNNSVPNADKSKTGLYLQRSSLDETDETLLLYRGIAELGREKGVMPHRKWRLEFDTDVFAGYEDFVEQTKETPTNKSPFLSDATKLYGTSDRTMNFIVPIIGGEDEVYGLCGFEISESYFKQYFAQSSKIEHLSCLLLPSNGETLHTNSGFSAGVYDGYYLPPQGEFDVNDIGGGLFALYGESSFIAKTKTKEICSKDYLLIVAYPKQEYDKEVTKNIVSVSLLVAILLGSAIIICLFFSKMFLHPIIKSLEAFRQNKHSDVKSGFAEVDDFFSYLDSQDKLHEKETKELQEKCDEQNDLLGQKQNDIDRLAYSRKNEISPDDYEMFKIGLKSLTKTEKHVFALYLEGKTSDEIMEICHFQKGTLKYHNHNILNKLGMQSKKQMLRYATLLKQEQNEKA